jgi:HlyD family secretion protein
VQTALAKLDDDAKRYRRLQSTYSSKLRNLEWLAKREVVAPLSTAVVSAEQGLTSTSVNLDDVKISEKNVVTNFQQVKLTIETQALQRRYQIDDGLQGGRVVTRRRGNSLAKALVALGIQHHRYDLGAAQINADAKRGHSRS